MQKTLFLCLFYVESIGLGLGQQNSTLFFMHSTPQANFVNPAIRNDCKWVIGLPVISSVHFNMNSTTFSVIQFSNSDQREINGRDLISKLDKPNFLITEFHTNLLYLGFWYNENFITFSINEKADLFVTYPHDLIALTGPVDLEAEGQTAQLSRAGIFFNYRREFAVGLARVTNSGLEWGIRTKLLFGKLNTSMSKSDIGLYSLNEPNAIDLTFSSNWQINTSLPIAISKNANNNLDAISLNGSVGSVLLNRKNLGLAFDLGFINQWDENVTISGSILDLGFTYWVSNGNAFSQNGIYTYRGPALGTTKFDTYFNDLFLNIKNQFGIRVDQKSYIAFLSPMTYLGATYKIKEDLNAGLLLSSRINRYRTTAGATLSLNKTFNKKASVSISYSYIYHDYRNIGVGIKLGRSPVQFYAVSDNVLSFMKPLDIRNLNLRFGLQINFGCNQKDLAKGCGCYWMQKSEEKRVRINRLLKRRTKN